MDLFDQLAKTKEEYYSIFPDDPLVAYDDDYACSAEYEISVFKWAIENRQHWYDYPNLSGAYSRLSLTYSDWRKYQEKS